MGDKLHLNFGVYFIFSHVKLRIAVVGRGKEENGVKMPIEKYSLGSELSVSKITAHESYKPGTTKFY